MLYNSINKSASTGLIVLYCAFLVVKECSNMTNISITACSFYLRTTNSKTNKGIYNLNDPFTLNSTCEVYPDISIIFKNFFQKYKLIQINEENKQSYSCEFEEKDKIEDENFIAYCARIFSGEYGNTADIIDLETKTKQYIKRANDIEIRPFYIYVVFPKDSKTLKVQKGMLIFQNIGSYGIKTITTTQMQDFFSNEYNISIECNCIAPKLFIDRLLKKDKIKKISLIKNYKSNDIADNLSRGYGREIRVLTDLCLTESKWEKLFRSIKYASQGKYNLFDFEKHVYDDAKIVVTIGEHDRTIGVHNIDKLSIIELIPNELKGKDGHPEKLKLNNYIKDVINDYLNEMVLTIGERGIL